MRDKQGIQEDLRDKVLAYKRKDLQVGGEAVYPGIELQSFRQCTCHTIPKPRLHAWVDTYGCLWALGPAGKLEGCVCVVVGVLGGSRPACQVYHA